VMKRFFILILAVLGMSCSEEMSDISLDQGYDFLPLEIGQYRLYAVEEIVYEVFEPDTSLYYLKEVIDDSLVSGDGNVRYLINRYIGEDSTSLELDSVWSVRKSEKSVVVTENNRDFVKLVFPVAAGRSWDGNAYNALETQNYYYQSVEALEWNGEQIEAENTIRLIIEDVEQNLVNQDERSELYLRNVGLVQKDYTQLSFCTVNCEEKGSEVGEIEKGRILKQELIRYGKE